MPTFHETKLGTRVPLIKTDDINDWSIITDKLANSSVTTEKLAEGSVSTSKIPNGAIKTEKIADGNITTDKLANGNVTTDKIADANITTAKIADANVTTVKIADSSITTIKIADKNVTTAKLADGAVTTSKLADQSVTNDKVVDDSLTINKLNSGLRNTIKAATGLPEDMIETIQQVGKSINKLNDTVYPIEVELSAAADLSKMKTTISFAVKCESKEFVPDGLVITKVVNDGTEAELLATPSSKGEIKSTIDGAKEDFIVTATKNGRTSATRSLANFIGYYGSSSSETITEDILNSFEKMQISSVAFTQQIPTSEGDFLWLVLPDSVELNSVTCFGLDVVLTEAQSVSNSLGTFKAYCSSNTLLEEKWNLNISVTFK